MNTDYIDLYWVHARDYLTPIDEVMRGLDDLVRQGKVLYVGVSDTPAWVVSQANTLAELRGWSRFIGLQIRYSLIDRTVERELLPMARAFDLGVTPWGIVGSGVLTGKYNRDPEAGGPREDARCAVGRDRCASPPRSSRSPTNSACTPSQVAINWVRQGPARDRAAGRRAHRRATRREPRRASSFRCPTRTWRSSTQVSAIEPGFPHDMLGPQTAAQTKIVDNHRPWSTPR